MTFDLPVEWCGHCSLVGTYAKFSQETTVQLCSLNEVRVRFMVDNFGKGVDLVDEIVRLRNLYPGVVFEVYHTKGYGKPPVW